MSEGQGKQILDQSFPRGVVVKCGLVFMAALLATAAVFFFMMRDSIGPTYGEGFRMLARLEEDMLYKSFIIYGSTALLALIGIAGLTMLYSHRVAGPIYRLRLFTGQVRRGDVASRVSLRRTDAIQPLADEMNVMVDGLHSTLDALNREIVSLEQEVKSLAEGRGGDQQHLRELEKSASIIAAMLEKYRL